MIPYDMESMKAIRASNPEARRFAALEFGASREWAEAAAARVQPGTPRRRHVWADAVVGYLLAR